MDKLRLEQTLLARQAQVVATALPAAGEPDLARYQLVATRAGGMPILLDNSLLDGMPGMRVLQVLRLGDGSLILADLGWRAAAQSVPVLRLPQRLTGQWLPWHARWTLPGARQGMEGVVDDVDRTALLQRYPGRWHAGVFILQPSLPGLQPWPLQPTLSSQRHFAYALQWLLLAVCVLLLWRRWARSVQ